MDMWLNCQITAGQFSGEFAIKGTSLKGEFSLFAPREDVDQSGNRIRVRVLDRRGGFALVKLPNNTLENGDTVAVRMSQLQPIHETV